MKNSHVQPDRPPDDAPRILIGHGDPRASLNLGDIAMVANLVAKLQRRMPTAIIRLIGTEPPAHWRIPGVEYVPGLISLFDQPGPLLSERIITRLCLVPGWKGRRRSVFRRKFAELVLAANRLPCGVRLSDRLNHIIQQVAWADVFVEAGHGGFADVFYEPDIADKLFLIRLARRLGKPVILSAHGYGPITSRSVLSEISKSLADVQFLGMRSNSGLTPETVSRLHLQRVSPCFTGDDACDLENAPDDVIDQILRNEQVPQGVPLVAIHVREKRAGAGESAMPLLQALIDHLTSTTNWHFIVVPMRYTPEDATDQHAAAKLKEGLQTPERVTVLRGEYNSREVRGVISRCVAGIGLAYHFSVFCLTQGIPSIGIVASEYYHGKVRGLYRHFDCEEMVFDLKCQPETAAVSLLKACADPAWSLSLKAHAADWSRRSQLPIDAIERHLPPRVEH